MCRALLPSWSGVSDARLEPIAGGITNALHKVTPETAVYREGGPEPVVLRVFGRGTERFLNRETETAALAELNAFGFGAACLGVFNNGRLEPFLADARPVTIEEMATPSVARAVAQTLRRLHACDVRARRGVVASKNASASASASASERTTRGTTIPSQEKPCQTWAIMRSWLDAATRDLEPGTGDPRLEALELHALRRDVDFLEAATTRKTFRAPIVLLHNDALAGNVMVPNSFRASGTASPLDPTPDVTLIDFEYSCYGPRGFDLANHLIEHCGFECDWRRLPSRAFRRDFCAAYLSDEAEDEEKVTNLLLETEAFYPVSHLWWGLWAAMQARTEKAIEFDYAAYAKKRLDEFRRMRRFAFLYQGDDAHVSGTTDDDAADLLGPRLPG